NRYSAVRIRDGDIERVLVLGACEALGGHLEAPAAEWEPVWTELVGSGLRVLLFAEARHCRPLGNSLDGWILQAMVLVALSDELRPEAGEVLEKLSGQGIAVKVISGDNPLTVHATVRQLALPLADRPVLTGDHLDAAPDRASLIQTHAVFGRVAPQQKLAIVQS